MVDRERIVQQVDILYDGLKEIETYCKEQNLKFDTTACDILRIIDVAVERLKNESN